MKTQTSLFPVGGLLLNPKRFLRATSRWLLCLCLGWMPGAFAAEAATYSSEVLSDAPLVYYSFDELEGATAANLGALGDVANGTFSEYGLVLGETSAAEDLGTAVAFSAGWVRVPNLGPNAFSQLSVEFWLKRNGEPADFFALFAADSWAAGHMHVNLPAAAGPPLEFAVAGNSVSPRFTPAWLAGEWHHVVVTYDTAEVKCYLNGRLFGTAAAGAQAVNSIGGLIGAWQPTPGDPSSAQRFLNGAMDEFALYGTVLSAARVQAHFNAVLTSASIVESPVDATVLAGQSAKFTVTANGSNLRYEWFKNGELIEGADAPTYVTPPATQDDDGSIFYVLVSNDLSEAFSSDAILTVIPLPTGTYEETVQADAPALYYRFDETSGTAAMNLGWLGIDAEGIYSEQGVTPGVTAASGQLGTAVDLNGSSGYVSVPALNLSPLTAMSIEFWMNRRTDPDGFGAIFSKDGWQNGDLHFNLVDGGPLLEFAISGNDGLWPRFTPEWPAEQWNHVVVTYEIVDVASQVKLYVNGALVGQAMSGSTPVNLTAPTRIGAWLNTFEEPDQFQRFFDGKLDEFALYNTVLTHAQVLQHFAAASPPPPPYAAAVLADQPMVYYRFNETAGTTAENTGTLGSAANGVFSASGLELGRPAAFPGLGRALALESGSVQVPDLGVGLLPQASVELWLKRQVEPADLTALYAGNGWVSGSPHINLAAGNPPLEFAVNGNPQNPRFNPNWPKEDWYHIVVTYDTASSQVSFYLNGALFGSAAAGATPLSFNGGQIGAWLNTFENPPVSMRFLNGLVDEFAIYSNVLSAERVLAHYSALPVGPRIASQPADTMVVESQTATFAVGATGPLLSYQWLKNDQLIDGATDASYVTPPTVASADNGAGFSVVVSNIAGMVTSRVAVLTVVARPVESYPDLVMADTPIAYYRFEESEGPTAIDSSSNARDGAYVDGVTLGAAGALPGSVSSAQFDGTSGYVQLPGEWGGIPEATVEAWVNTDEPVTGDFQSILATPDGGFTHFQLFNAGNSVAYTSGGIVAVPIPPVTPTGKWRHLVMTIKSGDTRLYIDGALVGAPTTTAFDTIETASFVEGGTRGLRIGNGHAGGRWFKGRIDEVAIYDQSLSAERVLQHYAAGQAAPAPRLNLARSGAQLEISWTAPNFVLQENSNVANPQGWTDVAGGDASPVMVTPGAGPKFYRLRQQ